MLLSLLIPARPTLRLPLSQEDIAYPADASDSVFITTAFTEYNQTQACSDAELVNGCTAPWTTLTTQPKRYVAGPEDLVIRIK